MRKSSGMFLIIFIMIIGIGAFYIVNFRFENVNNNIPENNNDNQTVNEIVDTSHTNSRVVIKLPILSGESANAIKSLIKSEVLNKINQIYGEDYVDLNLELDCNKKLDNDEMMSLVFIGVGYVKDSAYPVNVFISLNINLEDLSVIKLADLYVIDDKFVEQFRLYASDQLDEDRLLEVNSYSDEILKNKLSNSDIILGYSYYTQNTVGISLNVPHVLGDHLEVEIYKISIESSKK